MTPNLERLMIQIQNWLGSPMLGELPSDEVFDGFNLLSEEDKRTLLGFVLGIARGTQQIWAQEIAHQRLSSVSNSHRPQLEAN